jgi:hypothetical protein
LNKALFSTVLYDINEFRYLERSDRETVMRPEDFEDAVLNIRKAIGNLPDTKWVSFLCLMRLGRYAMRAGTRSKLPRRIWR